MTALKHHHLAIVDEGYDVEVWADGRDDGGAFNVTLYIDRRVGETSYVDLTPNEARALAALLVLAAEQQEKTKNQ